MTILAEGRHAFEFVVSPANGTRSFEKVTIGESTTLVVGQILGKKLTGTPTVTAAIGAGNVGDGVMGAATADSTAMPGVWRVVLVEPGTDAGDFVVENPLGQVVGSGTVAVAFNGDINFTLADGATDFTAGDFFTLTVDDALEQYFAFDQDLATGEQDAVGIACHAVTVGAAATDQIVAVVRDCEVDGAALTWPSDITADEKLAAIAQLKALGIIVL